MGRNFNLGLKRDQVHAIRCQMRRLEVDIEERNAQNDNDLIEHKRLSRMLEDAEHELWWQRFLTYCNTPCWRFRVFSIWS